MKRICSLFIVFVFVFCIASTAVADLYTDTDFILKVPKKNPAYLKDCENHGTIEKLSYTTHSYAMEAVADGTAESAPDENPVVPMDRDALCGNETEFILEKDLYVYLPYGYDASQKYDVFYLLHGTGEHEDLWLGEGSVGATVRNMLDWMIDEGKCKPMIVVTPTYYSIPKDKQDFFTELSSGDMLANIWPMYFWKELHNDIIPLVDSTYSTYGNETDARDHRAFMGISRGSMTTANSVFMHCLDDFSTLCNFSGIWCDFDGFKAVLESDEYKDLEIRLWYNSNGLEDFSLEHHQAFCERCLKEMPDRFRDGVNYTFVTVKGAGHTYTGWFPQIYNLLQVLFTR